MLLELQEIHKSYKGGAGIFKNEMKPILKGVSLALREGECLGIVGESGSGKSTLGRIALGLEEADSGRVLFEGRRHDRASHQAISVVFQDYTSSVNPRFRVVEILSEGIRSTMRSSKERREYAKNLLEEVGLCEGILDRFPHQLSGGQLQRVCIARAISTKPRFILLDEAVSSLDVSVQVQVLELLKNLKEKYNLAYLFITHDLMSATFLCDRLLFFQEGRIAETLEDIRELGKIQNPYSRSLLEAVKALEVPHFC
ncbi:ABC transporter ATP-binding protein [Wolinella succinogenes]|uniref:ABC transporter ATP-binding protein n=1 Tax=Wolinella succinogenes TaxID=844 RepID=UPI00240A373A|nr:ABC transporter ATP-binding protein [Wolinella succinogenes]